MCPSHKLAYGCGAGTPRPQVGGQLTEELVQGRRLPRAEGRLCAATAPDTDSAKPSAQAVVARVVLRGGRPMHDDSVAQGRHTAGLQSSALQPGEWSHSNPGWSPCRAETRGAQSPEPGPAGAWCSPTRDPAAPCALTVGPGLVQGDQESRPQQRPPGVAEPKAPEAQSLRSRLIAGCQAYPGGRNAAVRLHCIHFCGLGCWHNPFP